MNDVGRGDYVTYREHIAAKEEAQKRQAAVEMEVATIRAALMHLPDDVRKLTEAVQALASKMPQPVQSAQSDQLALGIHNLAQAISKQQQPTPATELVKLLQTPPPGAGWKTGLGYGALLTMIGILAWKVFVGG